MTLAPEGRVALRETCGAMEKSVLTVKHIGILKVKTQQSLTEIYLKKEIFFSIACVTDFVSLSYCQRARSKI